MMRGPASRSDPARMCLFTLWTIISLWFFRRLTSPARCRTPARWLVTSTWVAVVCGTLIVGGPLLNAVGLGGEGLVVATTLATPSHSSTIAMTSDDRRVVVVNREANSISVIKVRDEHGMDLGIDNKLAEIPVGLEPRCVAVHPNDQEAYVTNGISGTVSVVSLIAPFRLLATIPVGTEPRGCALTPNGTFLFVANHTEGTVSVISTATRTPVGSPVPVGRNPTAIAVTNNGDEEDLDETVVVTEIIAELDPNFVDPRRPDLDGETRDLGKRGVIHAFPVAAPAAISKIFLRPLSDCSQGAGIFTSNRTNFCKNLNPNFPATIVDDIFCPDPTATAPNAAILQNPQGCFPNQLLSAVIRGDRLVVPTIASQPEMVETFETNVQALVYTVDLTVPLPSVLNVDKAVNLNVEISTETLAADPKRSLNGVFGNDLVAIDANHTGDKFLLVSRGGNYVIEAIPDADGKLHVLPTIAGANQTIRYLTGNLPSGVVVSQDGTRAYANNEANFSVTSMDLENRVVLFPDIDSATPPAPGNFLHAVLVGKLAFFTALGIPDDGIFDTPIREFDPLFFRGKQSKDGWSSCGSCHPDGLADGVTWFFGTGPRQTKPLDGMFAKDNPDDQGILNWSAVRGSNTDFNANSRATQGGCGFASAVAVGTDPPAQCTSTDPAALPQNTPANPAIHDHGITQGGSDALDAQTLWIFAAVRPLKQPTPSDTAAFGRGMEVFKDNCASCHGGAKWTKSQIFHRDNPAAKGQNGPAFDPGVTNTANQFISFECDGNIFKYLERVGTFDPTDPREIRDVNGQAPFGAAGYNPPSLLSTNYHAPYLHRGQAQTLEEVFLLHGLGPAGEVFPPMTTIATELSPEERADLLVFLKAIDGTTDQLRSQADEFRDSLRLAGPPACGRPGMP